MLKELAAQKEIFEKEIGTLNWSYFLKRIGMAHRDASYHEQLKVALKSNILKSN